MRKYMSEVSTEFSLDWQQIWQMGVEKKIWGKVHWVLSWYLVIPWLRIIHWNPLRQSCIFLLLAWNCWKIAWMATLGLICTYISTLGTSPNSSMVNFLQVYHGFVNNLFFLLFHESFVLVTWLYVTAANKFVGWYNLCNWVITGN